ncbi:MAG: hypothetical protein LBK25_05600 [Treponema sp.]|jgi:hypothetical protein|nr:hypothetical protein [Treponema sp.]
MAKRHYPERYRRFKGCFGSSLTKAQYFRYETVELAGRLSMNDECLNEILNSLNTVMNNPETVLDMRKIESVNLACGLLLKSFFDEFLITHDVKPRMRSPNSAKIRAIFNYLEIARYQDVKNHHYKDIDCWQIKSWEQEDNLNFSRLLHEEIIPRCWNGSHAMSPNSANIASSVAETLNNCKEHAYTGNKEAIAFKRWYLGVGEYPDTKSFNFCVYDKGVGIKTRMKESPKIWHKVVDLNKTDSQMIILATQGRSGADKKAGRGEGLKTAIELLESNDGRLDIYSDYGYFSTDDEKSGVDRKTYLEGTMVAFSFPIQYTLKEGKKI